MSLEKQPWYLSTSLRLVLAWLACATIAGIRLDNARHEFDTGGEPKEMQRADGNRGHTWIDFGGQWIMGRMIVAGYGSELYNRNRQWQIARDGFPRSGEAPVVEQYRWNAAAAPTQSKAQDRKTDAENMMSWFMGQDSSSWPTVQGEVASYFAFTGESQSLAAAAAIVTVQCHSDATAWQAVQAPSRGGPLYPPVHALFYAPLGLLESAQDAYAVFQWLSIFAALLAGASVSWMSRGRIWTPLATILILCYPGAKAGLDLGQNHLVTLAILLGGWACLVRNRPILGGMIWALLAFKPVWGLAFLAAPVLLAQWRFTLSLAISGLSLCLATLPFVGVHSWQDWFRIGQDASALYNVNQNWINLSRDLAGVVRRLMIDFEKPAGDRGGLWIDRACWLLWASIFFGTLITYLNTFRKRLAHGYATAFLLLGCYLTCYRFMYYDVLQSVLVFAACYANWSWPRHSHSDPQYGCWRIHRNQTKIYNSMVLTILAMLIIYENGFLKVLFQATIRIGGIQYNHLNANGQIVPTNPQVQWTSDFTTPVETMLLLTLWLYWFIKLWRQGDGTIKPV